jgi:putative ABC transport system permease protein
MNTLLQDVRYGLRMLLKAPGVTGIAVLTLALGIGANSAIFSVVNAVLLRPLPYRQPAALVRVHGNNVIEKLPSSPVNPLDMADYRSQNRTLASLATFHNSSAVLTGRGEARTLRVGTASAGFTDVLGVPLAKGRFFNAEEEREGGERVIVLSHAFWQAEFGSDPAILDQKIALGGIPRRIIGVLSESFRSPIPGPQGEAEVWRPSLLPADLTARGGHFTWCIGRLKPGVTAAQAQADLNAIAAQIEKRYPASSTGWRTRVVPLRDDLVGEVRHGLLALLGAVGLVLAIACANVAGLLLGRAAGRTRELAIRRTLGAGAWRISRQLLTESVILSVAGGVFGILLASWAKDLILAMAGSSLPAWSAVAIDGRVLAFTAGVSVLTGVLFGLGPALHGARSDLSASLKEGGAQTGQGEGRARFRRLLVTGQMALCVVLLFGAGLLLQSLWHLLRTDTGYRTTNIATVTLGLPAARYPETPQIVSFYDRLLPTLQALPGMDRVGFVNILPLSGGYSGDSFTVDEHPQPAPGREPSAEHRGISEGYFETLGVPLKKGRLFTAHDDAGGLKVALINESMARAFFPGEDPLGKHLKYNEVSREIVGIVGDIRHFGVAEAPRPEYYFPFRQDALSEQTFVVRGEGDSARLIPAIRDAIRAQDAELAVANVRTLQDLVAASVAQPRFRALLLGTFAFLALLLSAVGVYGVLATTVLQRTREIGVRMALGARRADVLAMILREGMKLVAAGMAAGLAGSLALARILAGLLYQVSATDPFTYAAAAILLGCVALLACGLPAARAARVEPMTALRVE